MASSLFGSLASALEKNDNVEEEKEPFNRDPKYNYAFDIEDKDEKVFHAHKQNRDDKVRQ